MRFVFEVSKFYIEIDNIKHEVSEQLWTALMKRERKEAQTV